MSTSVAPEPHTSVDAPLLTTTHERFNLSPTSRISIGAALAYGTGAFLGNTHGARTSGLRFRAENTHRLPTNQRGWYLYHQAKNTYVLKESLKEGNRMGLRLVPWVALFFGIEEAMDTLRLKEDGNDSRKDFLSSTVAGVAVAGVFGAWNQVPVVTMARMAKLGLGAGFGFGVMQDALHLLRGQRLAYVDLIRKVLGVRPWGNAAKVDVP